jgi:hypothetical protein
MAVTGSRLRPCCLGHREKRCQCCRFGDLLSKTPYLAALARRRRPHHRRRPLQRPPRTGIREKGIGDVGDVGQQLQRRPGGSSGSVCWPSSLMGSARASRACVNATELINAPCPSFLRSGVGEAYRLPRTLRPFAIRNRRRPDPQLGPDSPRPRRSASPRARKAQKKRLTQPGSAGGGTTVASAVYMRLTACPLCVPVMIGCALGPTIAQPPCPPALCRGFPASLCRVMCQRRSDRCRLPPQTLSE